MKGCQFYVSAARRSQCTKSKPVLSAEQPAMAYYWTWLSTIGYRSTGLCSASLLSADPARHTSATLYTTGQSAIRLSRRARLCAAPAAQVKFAPGDDYRGHYTCCTRDWRWRFCAWTEGSSERPIHSDALH